MGVSSPPKMREAGRTCLCPTPTMFRCSVSVRDCSPLGVILNTCHEDKEQAVLPNQLPGLAGAEAMLGDAGMGTHQEQPRGAPCLQTFGQADGGAATLRFK